MLKTLTPLPEFTKWATKLWAFNHNGTNYFASQLRDGWAIVSEDDQATALIQGKPSRADATRALMLEPQERRSRAEG